MSEYASCPVVIDPGSDPAGQPTGGQCGLDAATSASRVTREIHSDASAGLNAIIGGILQGPGGKRLAVVWRRSATDLLEFISKVSHSENICWMLIGHSNMPSWWVPWELSTACLVAYGNGPATDLPDCSFNYPFHS